MVQKVIDVIGVSREGFSEAANDAIINASMTVREIRWARAQEFEVRVTDDKIPEYRAHMKIYFDVEGRE